VDLTLNLDHYLQDRLNQLPCQDLTKAYIIGIYLRYAKSAAHDLSTESLTITYSLAREKRDFLRFQNLADYIFFKESYLPDSTYSKNYYDLLAKSSYAYCFKILNHKLDVYSELADNFETLVDKSAALLRTK